MHDLYHEDLLDEARNPSNFGELEKADISTTQFNASCGDVVHVMLALSGDLQTVTDLKWRGNGCIISQAAMSIVSQKVIGMKVQAILELRPEMILIDLGITEISPGRKKCLSLGLHAVQNVLAQK